MSNVLMLLQSDHQRMAKLLDLIEQQATNIRRHEPVNHGLLASAFEYLSSYPDRCHHPKEDLVYRKLISRSPEMAGSLKDLVAEHEALADATRSAAQALRESRRTPSSDDGQLATQLTEFLNLYRHHMLMEDRYFFPVALARLSGDDFEEIDFTLFDQPDPLLDRESEARFAALRDEIMRLGDAENANLDRRKEAEMLAALRDAAAFNETMRQSGEPVCLVASPHAGYELRSKGDVLVHIPDCSESRAAWCAYFFWKGTARKRAAR